MPKNRLRQYFFLFSLILLASFCFAFSGQAANKVLVLNVPFTSQAPLANWQDSRQQDGCEEATALMAMAWVKSEGLTAKTKISKAAWEKKIIALSDFEKKKYGEYRDVTLSDMVKWIFKDYLKYDKVIIKPVTSAKDILTELEKGRIVLAPMNGRELKNPNFKVPGPITHMVLIKGYDYQTKQFITNDPGTRNGENYRYSEKIILKAIRVYPTGYHLPVKQIKKEIIVIEK